MTESEQNPQFNLQSSERIETAIEVRPLYALASASKIPIILPLVPHEQTTFEEFDRETRLGAEVVCAAICQQMNWDYLREAVHRELLVGNTWWRPEEIGQVDQALVVKLLSSYRDPSRVRPRQRAEMLRSLTGLFKERCSSYSAVFPERLDGEEAGLQLMQRLESCDVFAEDLRRKKLQVLAHRLAETQLVRGIEKFCKPAVDYHIMRLYLRRGDIGPTSQATEQYMSEGKNRKARTVTAFRGAVADAMVTVAELCSVPVHKVNSAEWWVGRSVCVRDDPDCNLDGEEAQWLKQSFSRCPFADTCFALNVNNDLLKFKEPKYVGRTF